MSHTAVPLPDAPACVREKPSWRVPTDWWRDFFGADYVLMYRGAFAPSTTKRQARCVVGALDLSAGARLLDVGCGQARHVRRLRQLGYRAFGTDFHPTQVRLATRRRSRRVARGDSRMLPFGCCFDGVISVDTSFGFFSDAGNARHLSEMARVLRRGGRLFLDLQNPLRSLRELVRERRSTDAHGGIVVVEEFHYDQQTRRIQGRKELRVAGRRSEHYFSLRQYTPDELMALCRSHGLQTLHLYGGYDDAPHSRHSERMIVVAEKT